MRPKVAHFALLGLITLAIVASFQAVGTLLVFGLLVGPPATAALLVRRMVPLLVTAIGVGVVAVVSGLLLSFHLDIAGGASMSLMSVVLFFVALALRQGRRLAAARARPT